MKVLLIEYEPRYVDRIRAFLAAGHHEVVVARDGDEGLDAYRRSRPDLVLISSVLPKLRTPDVIKAMQALGATPPILLMMSGYKGRNKRADAQRVGATSILEKPFGEEVFLAEVASALGEAPSLDLVGSATTLPGLDGSEPLLSADDIFSEIVSGIESTPPPPAPSPSGADSGPTRRAAKSAEMSVEKTLAAALGVPSTRLEAKPEARAEAKPPEPSEPPNPFETLKVNLAEFAATAAMPAARSPEKLAERTKVSTSASVDKLLQDTLSGLNIRPKSAVTGTTDPGLLAPGAPSGSRSGAGPVLRPPSSSAIPASSAPPPAGAAPAPHPLAPAPSRELTRESAPRPEAASLPTAPSSAPASGPARAVRPASGPGSFGRYHLLERIASGGMADVFKARMSGEEGFEKIVAIKRILPHLATNEGFITMFVDEAKLAAQLTHNNIIHIYELGKVDAWHYIAMEYVDGKDLRSILKMGRDRAYPMPVELALFITSRIASALDYAHRRMAGDGRELNLVHRDVSPPNILISWEGDIKLCDFGVAKAATKVSTTISGALKGKLQYMSPEQAWGKKIDRRSDIFSLGAVLFEALTGRNLFEGENDLSVLEKVRSGQVAVPSSLNPEVPPRIDQIVLKALAREPQDRYQNASDLEKDLLSVLYGFQPSPGPADLAIYLHRLLESPPAATDDDIEAAFAAAQRPAEETPKKGKRLVRTTRSSGEHLAPVIPAPELRRDREPSRPIPVADAKAALDASPGSKKSRAGLIAAIGVAAAVLVIVGVIVLRGRGRSPVAPAPEAASTAAPSTTAPAPATAAPTVEAQRVVDPKLVEAEARRLAAESEKSRRDAERKALAAQAPAASAPSTPTLSLAPRGALEPPKPVETAVARPSPQAVAVTEPPVVKVAPTEIPKPTEVSVPEPPPPTPPPASGRPTEGDLVGPADDVLEPKIVRMGAFTGLPPQAKQIARGSGDGSLGTSILMALIDENGKVTDVRVAKPAPYKFVDDAAIGALRNARINAATKDGVKVKMWATFAVTVKP
jgi:TonB family protein